MTGWWAVGLTGGAKELLQRGGLAPPRVCVFVSVCVCVCVCGRLSRLALMPLPQHTFSHFTLHISPANECIWILPSLIEKTNERTNSESPGRLRQAGQEV